jgi:hypothetical protein
VWIGLLIVGALSKVAQIGTESKTKYTAGGAIITLVANGLMVWWLIVVMQHLC